MKPVRWLIAAITELVSLIVDDVLTFLGAVIGLTGTYLIAHHLSHAWAGYLMYALVWAFLAVSMTRVARR